VDEQRMILRRRESAGQVIVRLPRRDRRHHCTSDEKTKQEDHDPLHGVTSPESQGFTEKCF
jgi:hypothetical protein